MRHKRLYLAALAHSFGGRSSRPLRSAVIRLLSLAAAASGLSFLIGKSMEGLPLPPLPHASLLVFAALFTVQAAAGFALLVAMGLLRAGQGETFVRLLLTWPISRTTRWVLFMLPSLILAVLAGILVGWPMCRLLAGMGLTWPLIVIGLQAGYASAFGLVHGLPGKFNKLLILWVAGIGWLEYFLLSHVNNIALPIGTRLWYGAALAAVCLALIGLAIAGSTGLRSILTATERGSSVRHTIPVKAWFAAKLLRRPNIRLSFGIALLMSGAVTFAARRYNFTDTEALSLFAAVLAASFATDIRALARRIHPAEITALKATARFSATYIFFGLLGGLLAVAPIIVLLGSLAGGWSAGFAAHICLQLLIGALAGLFAGTALIPEGRDISSQFMSTVLVLAILFAVPQLQFVEEMSMFKRNILDLLFCCLLVAGIFGIEQKRNPYYWRNLHAR